jgi:hypothetical protein
MNLLIILITSSLLVFGVILFMFKDYRIALIILSVAMLGIAAVLWLCISPVRH